MVPVQLKDFKLIALENNIGDFGIVYRQKDHNPDGIARPNLTEYITLR